MIINESVDCISGEVVCFQQQALPLIPKYVVKRKLEEKFQQYGNMSITITEPCTAQCTHTPPHIRIQKQFKI